MTSEELSSQTDQMLEQIEEENINKVKDILNNLYQIWSLVGVDEEQKLNRANNAWGYILDLSNEILTEERGFYEDIKERIKNYEKKILELSLELNISKIEIEGTLIVKEENLRQELDKLSKLKHKRIKEFQDLHSLELKFCKLLGMPPLSLSSTTGVPSESDLYELGQQVTMLKAEKEKRLKKLYMLKKELTVIFEETELEPESTLEKEILNSKECPSLSTDTFKLLDEIVLRKKNKKADLENEKKQLIEKVSILWDRLNVNKTEREIFLSRHNDCRISNLNAIKQEISRCEEIKRQNIKQYIDGLRKELVELWQKCFVAGSDRRFPDSNTDDVNEDVLQAFDDEVAKWRQYYKDVEHILVKIEKRHRLWELMVVFENKATDPNRFKNRRGNLLQEERERKKLQKDLPALENEIFADIEMYEEHGKPFLYLGNDFRDFINRQWEERQSQKETEKIVRQKLRTKQIENEITLGTTSCKRQIPSTPKSAPSKLFKSQLGVPVYRTPSYSASRPIPNTVAKMKTYKKPTLQSNVVKNEKNILKERNQNAVPGSSKVMDDTTYSHFAAKLNSSSRKAHRSSVLSSRKVVGTRTSNTSKRKSTNKSSRKSMNKKSGTSKILVTPARGKLGIPFLI